MATNYPTFQSDPTLNSVTASAGISSSLGLFNAITASNMSGTNNAYFGGNVGIGTTTPDAKLTVDGVIKILAQGVGEGGEIQLARAGDNAIKWIMDVIGNTDSTSNLRFFDNTGSVVMSLNTSTKAVEVYSGIKFPSTQVPSADVNTLDDYEEGGWIPTIYSTLGSGFTYNTSLTSGSYVKIGRAVMLNGAIVLTSTGSASNTIYIANLPFSVPSGASNRYSATFSLYSNLAVNTPLPVGYGVNSNALIALFKSTPTGVTPMQVTDLTNITTIYFSMHYNV